jgi:hypothetical protein
MRYQRKWRTVPAIDNGAKMRRKMIKKSATNIEKPK